MFELFSITTSGCWWVFTGTICRTVNLFPSWSGLYLEQMGVEKEITLRFPLFCKRLTRPWRENPAQSCAEQELDAPNKHSTFQPLGACVNWSMVAHSGFQKTNMLAMSFSALAPFSAVGVMPVMHFDAIYAPSTFRLHVEALGEECVAAGRRLFEEGAVTCLKEPREDRRRRGLIGRWWDMGGCG